MTAVPAMRWEGTCYGCKRERPVETRWDHAAQVLCDDCAQRPHKLPTATGIDGAAVTDDRADLGLVVRDEESGGLKERLAASRVDLLTLLDEGLPPRQWLPLSEGMFPKPARIHIAAAAKSGKTLSMLAHDVDMAMAGARITILDRENGAEEYARRLAAILDDRPSAHREAVRQRVRYYAWLDLRLEDRGQIAAAFADSDLVRFDSTRTFLSSLSLDEDRSDDYAQFAAAMVDPLFKAGKTVQLLDNAGHNNQGRPRGSSSKADLADVVYALKVLAPFDEHRAGRVKLARVHSRFGDVGAGFSMELGNGKFGTFAADHSDEPTSGGFRPTVLMERVSRRLEETPGLSWSGIRGGVRGNNDAIDLGIELLVAEEYVRVEVDGQARRHFSAKPYREDEDPHKATLPKPCPSPAHGQGSEDPAPLPPPIGAGGRVRPAGQAADPAPAQNGDQIPLASPEEEALAARLLHDEHDGSS